MKLRDRLFADHLRQLANAGKTRVQAAAECGVSYATVVKFALKHDIVFERSNCTKLPGEREHAMRALYLDGYTLEQIGQQFSLTRERVRQLLTKHFAITAGDGGQAVTSQKKREQQRTDREARCLQVLGCTLAQYRAMLQHCRTLRAKGVSYFRTPLGAFKCQQCSARRRGIPFEINFWQWWTVWQQSGKWDERGRGQGYVMCRRGDNGPYTVSNVFIAPARENSSKTKNKKSGLPIGVSASRGKFTAHRCIAGQVVWLGSFDTPALAHAAYLNAPIRRAPSLAAATGAGAEHSHSARATNSNEATR